MNLWEYFMLAYYRNFLCNLFGHLNSLALWILPMAVLPRCFSLPCRFVLYNSLIWIPCHWLVLLCIMEWFYGSLILDWIDLVIWFIFGECSKRNIEVISLSIFHCILEVCGFEIYLNKQFKKCARICFDVFHLDGNLGFCI